MKTFERNTVLLEIVSETLLPVQGMGIHVVCRYECKSLVLTCYDDFQRNSVQRGAQEREGWGRREAHCLKNLRQLYRTGTVKMKDMGGLKFFVHNVSLDHG